VGGKQQGEKRETDPHSLIVAHDRHVGSVNYWRDIAYKCKLPQGGRGQETGSLLTPLIRSFLFIGRSGRLPFRPTQSPHSLSSWLVNKGKAERKTVQSLLRHSRIQTTLDLYTQGDGDETRGAQGAFLRGMGLASELVK
jgi:integrase